MARVSKDKRYNGEYEGIEGGKDDETRNTDKSMELDKKMLKGKIKTIKEEENVVEEITKLQKKYQIQTNIKIEEEGMQGSRIKNTSTQYEDKNKEQSKGKEQTNKKEKKPESLTRSNKQCRDRYSMRRNKTVNVRKRIQKRKRSMKNKSLYKNFKAICVNCQGMHGKIESIKFIIEEEDPTIMCLLETLEKDNEDQKEESKRMWQWLNEMGYEKVCNNRKERDGGGIMVLIKNKLNNVTVVTEKVREPYEGIWLLTDNGRIKLKMGFIYGPQESRTKSKQIDDIYKHISREIDSAEENNQRILAT